MYIQTGQTAWAKADRAEGVFSFELERPSHSSDATESQQFQGCAKEFLSADDERRLATAWRERGDVAARNAIVEAHRPLLWRIAKTQWKKVSKKTCIGVDDIFNIGCLGLLKAIDRFDPTIGVRLSSYAKPWVSGDIKEFVRNNRSVVRGGSLDEPFSDDTTIVKPYLPKWKGKDLTASPGGAPRQEQIRRLRPQKYMSQDEVVRLVADYQGGKITKCQTVRMPLDLRRSVHQEERVPISREADGDSRATSDHWAIVPAPPTVVQPVAFSEADSIQERTLIASQAPALWAEIHKLKGRDQVIIQERRLVDDPTPYRELSDRFSISIERVRQIEARAIQKLAEARFGLATPVRTGRRVSVDPLPDQCSCPRGQAGRDNSWPCAWTRDEIAKYLDRWPVRRTISNIKPTSDWRPHVRVAARWTNLQSNCEVGQVHRAMQRGAVLGALVAFCEPRP